jgi:hypothetical protein
MNIRKSIARDNTMQVGLAPLWIPTQDKMPPANLKVEVKLMLSFLETNSPVLAYLNNIGQWIDARDNQENVIYSKIIAWRHTAKSNCLSYVIGMGNISGPL